jgi:hypothetical protein
LTGKFGWQITNGTQLNTCLTSAIERRSSICTFLAPDVRVRAAESVVLEERTAIVLAFAPVTVRTRLGASEFVARGPERVEEIGHT